MSNNKGGTAGTKKPRGETLQFKSPAEFFAENQNIAGFDNPGKALYTTIREFVENALDAAESVGELPDISVCVEEMDTAAFNEYRATHLRGAGGSRGRAGQASAAAGTKKALAAGDDEEEDEDEDSEDELDDDDDENFGAKRAAKPKKRARTALPATPAADDGAAAASAPAKKGKAADMQYFRVSCRDNGCGMPHASVPNMLGRVLAGSKYGVRQTRGKFGLGAKMALIWSKKSTGLPIEVQTAHRAPRSKATGGSASAAAITAPKTMSRCVLDIDIYKNEPHIIEHVEEANSDGWIGTLISVVIAGAWTTYRARVMQYFQQLAVITPYAQFSLEYKNVGAGATGKNDFSFAWKRRSTQIPLPPKEVKHHPSAVNDLLITQLMDLAKHTNPACTVQQFLMTQFQCIDRARALAIIDAAGDIRSDTPLESMSPKRVHDLRRAMEGHEFPEPSGDCLSPAGEYNLRLGVLKELRPDMVATASSPVGVFQGHPFIVEAAVALGGRGSEGLTVHRFANRIPLLFEGGGDVATQTATKRVAWGTYKIDPSRDKIAVFVSLVSTKIPFKGTGKEYIGDDIEEIRAAVKSAITACCTQLRVKLLRASSLRAKANRKKLLVKYIPDVCRAVFAHLKTVGDVERESADARSSAWIGKDAASLEEAVDSRRVLSPGDAVAAHKHGVLTDGVLSSALQRAIDKADLDAALEEAAGVSATLMSAAGNDLSTGSSGSALRLAPLSQRMFEALPILHCEHAVIRLLPGVAATLQF